MGVSSADRMVVVVITHTGVWCRKAESATRQVNQIEQLGYWALSKPVQIVMQTPSDLYFLACVHHTPDCRTQTLLLAQYYAYKEAVEQPLICGGGREEC